MKLFVGVTDNKWFEFLAARAPDEVNFWRPSGKTFKAIPTGAPFLFKLHSPLNYIAGGGFFVKHTNLPLSLAWKAFSEKNGASTLVEFEQRIRKHRKDNHWDPVIGCTILAEPFFLPREEWIAAPASWASNIVSGRTYSEGQEDFHQLWDFVISKSYASQTQNHFGISESSRFGSEYLARARLGQGAFRVLVLDAYHRRCAVTGERVLPVLEAAHIKPYSEEGPHHTSNGLLLRSDLHTLFDSGYITVTRDLKLEVSKQIHEEFDNGKMYYSFHGQLLSVLPDSGSERPAMEYIDWHNSQRFLG